MYKYYGLAAFVVLLDQWTKWLIVKNMEYGERIAVLDPWFGILSHRNRGAAWGMLEGQMWLFSIVTVAVICAIVYFYHREAKGKPIFQVGLMLLLGGAIGNFIDRIFRGEVVDFVDVLIPIIKYDFPIFNVADAALTIAVVILMIGLIMEDKKEKKQVKQ
ncbi:MULTISPECIES: signal peptidase II [Bacteria]|uniref:Lipoprotein signal peptidase n=1 Tax=Lysinibacillus fusiformis TaxID=28031 RepID=A0A1H9DGQ3_9BACI|nr:MULTISPECIES: signal peptidase II [Lysinibacillus]HAU32884.1 lipoprotein signal peptidase [Lysinibacillus sp.]MED4074748.1 signal peptidase II [Lysinibacillus fusiformis]MED4668563.1 signal peptidase II [Lysinibacillus fusiformis]NOG27626.1 signal peptidase II [Lysinibacillus fusiformis]PCD83654.1 lipoprotein signal peptidase [Lysinibacillus fusiformis]